MTRSGNGSLMFLLVVIPIITLIGQTQPKPAAKPNTQSTVPVLSFKQQMDVAVAVEKINVDQKALESIPGVKQQMAKVQDDIAAVNALSMQLCISSDGKHYQLDHSTGVWICREVPAR